MAEQKQVMDVWMCRQKTMFDKHFIAFVSEEAILEYYKALYPNKRSLRFMRGGYNKYYLMNHNSHIRPYHTFEIRTVPVYA